MQSHEAIAVRAQPSAPPALLGPKPSIAPELEPIWRRRTWVGGVWSVWSFKLSALSGPLGRLETEARWGLGEGSRLMVLHGWTRWLSQKNNKNTLIYTINKHLCASSRRLCLYLCRCCNSALRADCGALSGLIKSLRVKEKLVNLTKMFQCFTLV